MPPTFKKDERVCAERKKERKKDTKKERRKERNEKATVSKMWMRFYYVVLQTTNY